MPTVEAQIQTERASRYLVQFCKHAAAMGAGGHTSRMHLHGAMARGDVQVAAEWSDTEGTVTFTPWGRCTLIADGDMLTLRIDANDEDGLVQIRDVITRDLERFSHRDPLTVSWGSETPGPGPFRHTVGMTPKRPRRFPQSKLQALGLVLAVFLVVAFHLGLAGTVVAKSAWTGLATAAVVTVVAVKIALVALARAGTRRRRATNNPELE